MSKLSNHLVEQILLEESKIKKVVVVYVGRFQPMHQGHYKTFAHLQKKFGKNNVYVGTSNKTEKGRSPFNFREKKKIMTTMFPIPSNRVVQVKNPYAPTEVLKKFDKDTTAFVTVVGQKDASRLSHKYFKKWDGNPTDGYEETGYLYVAPMQGGAVSGTEVRNGLSQGSDEQKEKFFKDRAYGKFNKNIFKMVTDKLSESLFVPKETIEEYMMEISTGGLGGLDVDDGPNFFISNYKTFRKVAADRATKLGYTIVNMIGDEKFEDYYEHPEYPDGPQTAVSYFPAGVIGTMTPNNQVDIYSSGAYSNWYKHVTRKAALVGYDVIKKLDIEKDDKEQSTDDAEGAKDLEKEFESSLTEAITLPVEIGDTILVGRFKNKKLVVKDIGVDDHGMPTINGRKVVTFRLVKEDLKVEFDDVEYPEDMPQDESKGRLRPADLLRRKASMAGKRAAIARKRKRTMKRKKPLAKLKKIAYKKAYLQVYDEFMKDLYPGKKKSELSIQQAKVVHKNVLRKKGRVRKRARFRFLPALRAKEAEKFDGKESLGYPGKKEMAQIKKRVDIQRSNTDSDKDYQYKKIDERVNEFFYMDFKKYVWKRRGEINRKLKGLSPKEKKTFLELLWKKQFGANKSWSKVDGSELHQMLKKDKYVKEGLKEKGITDFKSLFKKMPSDLQKRVYNLKNFGQRADKHPEGNVLKHTIMVVNRSIKDNDIDIAIAAMFHDIGKDETAGIHPKKGHITHFGHEKVSASLVKKYKKFIESVGGNTANVFYIVKNHMKYKQLSVMRPKKVDKVKSFRAFDKLSKFSKHDRSGLDESTLKLRIPSDIIKIQKGFKKNGKKLYVVGGAVRDAILGKSPKDFDLATDAKPDEVLKIAKDLGMKTVEVGKSFGVVMVGGHEIATFRKDIGKGRRPSSVDYTDIEGDVRRRDLTVNALFYDIDKKEIVDLVGGISDLKKKKIRTVGKAEERFEEDPLRKLRALRFQARLGGSLDKDLLNALQKDPSLKGVSSERIRDEFVKSLKSAKDTKKYMELCDKIGFTSLILPNLKINKPYIKDNDYILFLANLLRKNQPSVLTKTLNKLTYSNDERNNIVFLVTLDDFKPEEILTYKKLQNKTSLSDDQIKKFGKLIGKDMGKFVKFNLSVGGKDVPSDIKGPQIGLWIKNKEKENFLGEGIITEGGAYGHMNHPFDSDVNLTFGQLKDIVNRALDGTLENTREKTDGQALAISWRDNRLVAARNKGHLKNKGENALDIRGVSDKFQGRGGLSDAYNFAMRDLSKAISSLSEPQRKKVFKDGSCFMNLEVIYPTSVNVIPYGQALLVFHGTMEYNDEGVAIGENQGAARILAGMIKQVNQNVQSSYTIEGPPVVKLPKSQDLSKKKSVYSGKIKRLQKKYNLKDTDGVSEYHQAFWENYVDKKSPTTLDNKTKMGLVKRWAFFDKKFRLDSKNISDSKTLDWAKKTDKEKHSKIAKDNIRPFEDIFLGLGAEVLQFVSSAMTVNPDKAIRDMKKKLDKTIKDVKKSGDEKKIQKLKLELQRLKSIGGAKKIVPNEGIVFTYNGKTFKLTGTFAPLNQILGIFF